MGLNCYSNENVNELTRCVRMHLKDLLGDLN